MSDTLGFTAGEMVTIGGLSSPSDMDVLCTQIEATVKAQLASGAPLPPGLARASKRVADSHQAFLVYVQPAPPPPISTKDADLWVDRGWGAARDTVKGWSAVPAPYNPDPEGCEALGEVIYGGGMGFINAEYHAEWSHSKTLLTTLEEPRYQATITRLGLTAVFENLKAAHAAYGRALGITRVKVEEPPQLRSAMGTCRAALKEYILKAAAWADPEVEGSLALSDALLAPVRAWVEKSSGSQAAAPPPSAPSAAPPVA